MANEQPLEDASREGTGRELDPVARAAWQRLLVDGQESLRRAQHLFRHLPGPPRCKLCHNPFGGVGGKIVRLAGFKPSRKNPNLCANCCDRMPTGGLELDIAVVFADIRGSTMLCDTIGTSRFADLLNSFYRRATECLVSHDAIIDKLIGDEVMALFIPGIAGIDYRHKAALAAIELVRTMADQPPLPVGAAVNSGRAYVGNVGTGQVVDFTALGDPVNTASRLQSQAAPGEVIMSDEIFATVRGQYPDAPRRQLEVRGRSVPASVRVVTAS